MDTDDNNSGGVLLTDEQRLNWLRLYRCENIGPSTFRELLNTYGSASSALEMLPQMALRNKRKIRIATQDEVLIEMEGLSRLGGRLICQGEPDYPPILRSSDNPPPVISVLGSTEILRRPSVSFVGSRNASLSSVKLTGTLAREVGESGYAVVSGFARGIDTAAHEGSLETGTIGVFAGGIDIVYPDENRDLLSRLLDSDGAILSEMSLGSHPRAQDFPRRNRIIAGLSIGVVVVEAAQRSGSLISARYANEMGRLVFAVPGSPLDPRSVGTNGLIREGAILVTSSSDIIEALAPLTDYIGQAPYSLDERDDPDLFDLDDIPDDSDRALLLSLLNRSPVSIDDLIHHTGFSVSRVHFLLLEFSVSGLVERHVGNRVSLI